MSSYSTYQKSKRGKPRELYKFTLRTGEKLYTSFDDDIDSLEGKYLHQSISRSEPEQSGEIEMSRLRVFMPRTLEPARQYIPFVPPASTWLTIYRFHESDPAKLRVIFWQGLVRGAQFNGDEATLECEPFIAAWERNGLRRRFQTLCAHILYDINCKVNREDYRMDVTASSVIGSTVVAAGAEAYPDGWFTSGYMETVEGDRRLITNHVGNILTLVVPFGKRILTTGDTPAIFAGCAHDFGTCIVKFDNEINHGGYPFVPNRNNFVNGLDVNQPIGFLEEPG